jgi:hypothetical protein
MPGVLLTLGVVLLAAPAGKDPLKGCEVLGPVFGLDRFVRCRNFQVEIYPPMPAAIEASTLSELARSASTFTDGRESVSMADVKIAGKVRRAFRYLKYRADGTRPVGLFTTVPIGKNEFRLVHCHQGLDFGCLDVFASVMKGLPEVTGEVPAKPTLASVPLTIPKGCSRKGHSHLACGANEASWATLYPGGPETLEQVDPLVRRSTIHLGKVEAADRYCSVAATDALCRVATLTAPDGTRQWFVYAFVRLRQEPHWVACSTRSDPKDGLPAPCNVVMEFKPPAQ